MYDEDQRSLGRTIYKHSFNRTTTIAAPLSQQQQQIKQELYQHHPAEYGGTSVRDYWE